MRRRAISFAQREDGAVAVEFALVLPLLLAILFGIVCFGQYFAIANSLQQLAAEAARHSVLELAAAKRVEKANAFIADAQTRFPILRSGKVSHRVALRDISGPGIEVTLTYDLSGSAVDVVDGFLGLEIPDVSRSSYLAY